MASINLQFADDDLALVQVRTSADLPSHVTGRARWLSWEGLPNCYATRKNAQDPNEPLTAVEFINDRWYKLEHFGPYWHTRRRHQLEIQNEYGLGFWRNTDPQYPSHLLTTREAIEVLQEPTPRVTVLPTEGSSQDLPIGEDLHNEQLTRCFTEAMNPFPTSYTSQPITQPPVQSQRAQTTEGHTGTAVTEQKGSLTGNPPAVFDGNRTKSQDFIHEFELWWDLNREHPIMKEPYR